MIKIFAWIVLILYGLAILLHPLVWGKEREPYGPATWFALIMEAILIIPLALKVLGYI